MAYTGHATADDLAFQDANLNLKIGTPDSATLNNLTVLSGATLPAFDSLVVKTAGTSQVGTVTAGTWQGSGIKEVYGGTGQTSYTLGDLLYASATNVLSKLGIGSTDQLLKIVGGVPVWGAAPLETVLNSSAITVAPASTDRFVMVSGAPGSPTVTLPSSPSIGQRHTVKDRAGTAATSGITIDGNGTAIDTLPTTSITANFGSVEVVYDGAQWDII